MSDVDIFSGRDSFYSLINRSLRDSLTRARPYQDRFEEFRVSVVENEDEIIGQLTQCDRSLVAAFANEARGDLERVNRCYSD